MKTLDRVHLVIPGLPPKLVVIVDKGSAEGIYQVRCHDEWDTVTDFEVSAHVLTRIEDEAPGCKCSQPEGRNVLDELIYEPPQRRKAVTARF